MLNDFDRTYVINLPERKDRRIQMERHLGDLGATRVRFFPAIRADRARPFRSAEQAGCFLSHRRVLMEAYADGLESVLILEDDAEFVEPQTFHAAWGILRPQLDDTSWGVFQAGWLRLGGRAAPIDVTPTLMRMRD